MLFPNAQFQYELWRLVQPTVISGQYYVDKQWQMVKTIICRIEPMSSYEALQNTQDKAIEMYTAILDTEYYKDIQLGDIFIDRELQRQYQVVSLPEYYRTLIPHLEIRLKAVNYEGFGYG